MAEGQNRRIGAGIHRNGDRLLGPCRTPVFGCEKQLRRWGGISLRQRNGPDHASRHGRAAEARVQKETHRNPERLPRGTAIGGDLTRGRSWNLIVSWAGTLHQAGIDHFAVGYDVRRRRGGTRNGASGRDCVVRLVGVGTDVADQLPVTMDGARSSRGAGQKYGHDERCGGGRNGGGRPGQLVMPTAPPDAPRFTLLFDGSRQSVVY